MPRSLADEPSSFRAPKVAPMTANLLWPAQSPIPPHDDGGLYADAGNESAIAARVSGADCPAVTVGPDRRIRSPHRADTRTVTAARTTPRGWCFPPMSDPRSPLLTWRKDMPRSRATPWKDAPAEAGPTVIISIDHVVASMDRYTHLIDAEHSRDRDWATFHRSFGKARLIVAGKRLVEDLVAADYQIAWSSTRPEQFARATMRWMNHHRLPLGPIMFRHYIKDGPRPPIDIKLRHWWSWTDNYGDTNPIIGWVEPEPAAINALRAHGCPAWHPKDLTRRSRSEPINEVLEHGPIDLSVLQEHRDNSRAEWQLGEDAWQARRSAWWEKQKQVRRRSR